MRISKLIEALEEIKAAEGDISVILSSDEEGNNHRDLWGVQVDWVYDDDDEMSPVADEDAGTEYDLEDLMRMVVLW